MRFAQLCGLQELRWHGEALRQCAAGEQRLLSHIPAIGLDLKGSVQCEQHKGVFSMPAGI